MIKVQAVPIDIYCLLAACKPENIKQLLREHKYHLKTECETARCVLESYISYSLKK